MILGIVNLATSVSLGRKGVQETCTNSTSPPSGRSVFPDISAEPLSVRSHPRTGGHSFKLPDSGQSLRRLRLEQQQRGGGARGASGPPLARDSGGGFGYGRVRSCPLREGVWRAERWAVTRPHSEPRPEKGVHHRHTGTPEPALHNTHHAARTRVLATPVRTQVLHVKHGATQSTAQCARKHLSARSSGSHARPPPPHHRQGLSLR